DARRAPSTHHLRRYAARCGCARTPARAGAPRLLHRQLGDDGRDGRGALSGKICRRGAYTGAPFQTCRGSGTQATANMRRPHLLLSLLFLVALSGVACGGGNAAPPPTSTVGAPPTSTVAAPPSVAPGQVLVTVAAASTPPGATVTGG